MGGCFQSLPGGLWGLTPGGGDAFKGASCSWADGGPYAALRCSGALAPACHAFNFLLHPDCAAEKQMRFDGRGTFLVCVTRLQPGWHAFAGKKGDVHLECATAAVKVHAGPGVWQYCCTEISAAVLDLQVVLYFCCSWRGPCLSGAACTAARDARMLLAMAARVNPLTQCQ